MWPDRAKFHHFGKYLKFFGDIFKVYLVLGNVSNLLSQNLFAVGQIFITEKGQVLKTQFGHLVTLVARNHLRKSLHFCRRLRSKKVKTEIKILTHVSISTAPTV